MIGIDLFCGAGGMSTGAAQAGVDVRLAINHWQPAVWSHGDNHPDAAHYCARIEDVDPFSDPKVPRQNVWVLFGGPSCQHHSVARGGQPINDQQRTHPYEMLKWVEACSPSWVVVENVPEFENWGPINKRTKRPIQSLKGKTFQSWVASLESLNYSVDWRVLNAADYGAPTKRRRLFIVARRGHGRTIPWPAPTHAPRDRAEELGLKPWRAVAECIDWNNLGQSIFDRAKPLADNTIRRIEAGLERFVGQAAPYLVKLRGTSGMDNPEAFQRLVGDTADPLSTITASGNHHGLAVPFVYRLMGPGSRNENEAANSYSPHDPIPTIVAARQCFGVLSPFLTVYHNGEGSERRHADPAEPLGTLDTSNRYGMATPFVMNSGYSGDADGSSHAARCDDPRNPMRTLTTKPDKMLVQPFLVPHFGERPGQAPRTHALEEPAPTLTSRPGQLAVPFLVKYYGTGKVADVRHPLDTITVRDRFGLATARLVETMERLGVADIHFRMLGVQELLEAQGFPADYQLMGTKTEQTRMIGNSVPPHLMAAICNELRSA